MFSQTKAHFESAKEVPADYPGRVAVVREWQISELNAPASNFSRVGGYATFAEAKANTEHHYAQERFYIIADPDVLDDKKIPSEEEIFASRLRTACKILENERTELDYSTMSFIERKIDPLLNSLSSHENLTKFLDEMKNGDMTVQKHISEATAWMQDASLELLIKDPDAVKGFEADHIAAIYQGAGKAVDRLAPDVSLAARRDFRPVEQIAGSELIRSSGAVPELQEHYRKLADDLAHENDLSEGDVYDEEDVPTESDILASRRRIAIAHIGHVDDPVEEYEVFRDSLNEQHSLSVRTGNRAAIIPLESALKDASLRLYCHVDGDLSRLPYPDHERRMIERDMVAAVDHHVPDNTQPHRQSQQRQQSQNL